MLAWPVTSLAIPGPEPGSAVEPVTVIQTHRPEIPAQFLETEFPAGEATVVIMVDETGQLLDLLVESYTHPALGGAAARSLRHWAYQPARSDGRPLGARQRVTVQFEPGGNVVTLTAGLTLRGLTAFAPAERHRRIVAPPELDRPPAAVHQVAPSPVPLPDDQDPLQVVLDFYIDNTGRPRLPVVVGSASEPHAAAALVALSEWRFTPPTRRGAPVAVQVQQEFVFSHQP